MWTVTKNGSIFDQDNNSVFISLEHFKEICGSNSCFLCGKSPSTTQFNDEHIFPRWLLKDLNLFNEKLNLPNLEKTRYSTYKIRCCTKCNLKLSTEYEEVVSKLLRNHERNTIIEDEAFKIYKWMALIFLKVHLRDRHNPNSLNQSNFDGMIADDYMWSFFHHIHALVRTDISNTKCEPITFGTFFTFPFSDFSAVDKFDYADLLLGRCAMLRYKDTCFFAVFDDGRLCNGFLANRLSKIDGPINRLQAIEILIELAFVQVHLSDSPEFSTTYNIGTQESSVGGKYPDDEVVMRDLNFDLRASFMEFLLTDCMGQFNINTDQIATGRLSFLFDDDGNFRKEGIYRVE